MGDLTGRNLGPYRILEQIGAGGMATVYKAYQPAMDRYVAIKVLPKHLAQDPNFRARFQREAHTIARLEHRYILPTHDVSEEDGIPFLVMRYTDGGTLSDLIAGGTLMLPRAIQLVSQVGEALSYAHAQGVIHRDIKPANILIGRDGGALLTDFGIAKIVETTLQLTSEGALVGTPAYMAPEQLLGKGVDARSDIYALGVVLYQALTGECPFVAETPLAVALMHVHNPLRPPRELNPAIPEALERIILRAMAKDPADRFQTADEMVVALNGALAEPALPSPASSAEDSQPAALAPPAAQAVLPPPASPPQPAITGGVTRPARPVWLWAGIGLVAAALILGLALLRLNLGAGTATTSPGPTAVPAAAALAAATTAPVAEATVVAALPPGPTVTPRAKLQVLATTNYANVMVPLGNSVWAATDGGLVRYSPDGSARVFNVDDGLPFNWTPALIAGKDATLWAGAYARVAQIRPVADGLGEVTTFTTANGLDIGRVNALLADSDGSIWAAGEEGLRRFDGTTWRVPDLPLDDPLVKDLTSPYLSLLRAQDGALWIGRDGDGLLQWDGKIWTRFAGTEGVGSANHYGLFQDKAGTLWCAAGDLGLLRFDPAAGRWQKVEVGLADAYLHSVTQLADGRLLASTEGRVAQSANGGTSWTQLDIPEGYGGSGVVGQAADGRIWVGGASSQANGQWTKLAQSNELSSNQIGGLALAPDGKLWTIPQYGGNVAIVDPATMSVERFDMDARIYALAFTKDTSWVGTSGGLVRLRNGARKAYTSADSLPSDEIRALLATNTALWIGTNNGLAMYDLASETISSVPEFDGGIVQALLLAPDGAIWAGSHRENELGFGALGRFDGHTWQIWRKSDLPSPDEAVEVTGLSADGQGQIWALTWSSGIHRWDGSKWRSWTEQDGAPTGSALALLAHGDEMLFGGVYNSSLFRWNKDGWSTFQIDGLSGNVLAMITTSDGALWLGTDDGLLRLSPDGIGAQR